jgi:carboxypeptidase D
VLVLIFLVIGIFMWCRVRRRKSKILPSSRLEESIPLNSNFNGHASDDDLFRQRKGKERAEPETVFDVGDDEDENDFKSPTRR